MSFDLQLAARCGGSLVDGLGLRMRIGTGEGARARAVVF